MYDLTGKKLLILGGTKISMEIVRYSKKLGATVFVTDYLVDSPAKKIADKNFLISIADVDDVVKLIKEEKIDGVLTGFEEIILPFYQQICQKANLPCYATQEQFDISIKKNKFKDLCKKFNIPVVPEYELNYPLDKTQIATIDYPVLIKPVDNSGARGIFICNNSVELLKNYEFCLNFSKSKKILVEKYMQAKEATIFYLMQDGEIILSSMADRHIKYNQEGVVPLPVCYTFPSRYLEQFQNTLNQNVVEAFKSIGIKNGMIFIQSFIENGSCIFYEMGYRLTGSLEYKIIEKFDNINPLELLINFALTGKMSDLKITEHLNPNYSNYGFNITFLVRPGQIGNIVGVDQVFELDGIIDVVNSYEINDVIAESAIGTLQQVVLRVFGVVKDKTSLKNIIDQVQSTIKVFDIDGKNMMLGSFDTNELYSQQY